MEDQEAGNIEEDFQEQLKVKIKHYFESNPPISKNEFDNFLSAIGLLEIWNSEEEKETVWQWLSKYMKDSKINCEDSIKGLMEFLIQEEEAPDEENKDINKKETLLTRLSRISTRGVGGIGQPTANKLALNKYKQRAIDEYDCLDNNSLIQFKKIFALLKLNKSNLKIKFDELKEILFKYKFIKIDPNDIWRFLSFCVYEENLKNLEQSKEYNLNNDILEEVKEFIDQKIINEDLDYDSDNLERENDNDNDNDSISSSDRKKFKEDDPLALIGKIIKHSNNTNENNMVLIEIKNEIKRINNDMVDCGYKILNKEELTMDEMENNKEKLNEKLYQIEQFYTKTKNEIEDNIGNMELLKENILKTKEKLEIMKKDYKDLFEKYNNNQELDIDEETERLLDENLMLTKEKENKQQEIEQLLEDKKTMRKEYQNLLMRYEDAIKEKNEISQEVSELKINNYKLQSDYDKLLNDIMMKGDNQEKEKKTKKKEKKEDKKEDKNSTSLSYEEQLIELKKISKSGISDAEKISKKKSILKEMANEKLINYIMEIDKINQILSNERSLKERKIYEMNQKNVELSDEIRNITQKNVELEEENKNLERKIDNLNNDIKNNEMFRPSIAMNSQMRISRLSKLNNIDLNKKKFQVMKGTGFSTKKNVGTYKLREKNINVQIGSQGQKTKFENISMDLYGVKEVDDEEEDQDNKKNKKENKNEFNISNQNDLSISNKGLKNNVMSISNNNDIKISENNQLNKNSNNNEMNINNNQINIINNGDKVQKSNINQNTFISNNAISISKYLESNSKKELELKTNSNQFDISGKEKEITDLKQSGIEFDITKGINTLSTSNDQNAVIEIDNINDINLTGTNEITFGKNESEAFFGKEEDNKNSILEVQNANLFFDKEDKNKNNNQTSHVTFISFFDPKLEQEEEQKPQNYNISDKKEEKKEDEDNLEEEVPTLKIDNLIGNLADNEILNTNANESSSINKNAINLNKIEKQEIKEKKEENTIIEKNNQKNNINEIQKGNEIIVNNNRTSSKISKEDGLDRSRTNTVVYNNNDQRSTGNLEDIMIKGMQKEGFNIDDSSRKESFLQNNQNSINISGEKKNEDLKDKINENKKDFQIDKSKGREIIMSPTSKMFQNMPNSTNNNFSISSDKNNNNLLTKTFVEKDLRMSSTSSNKMEIFPSHNNSVYFHYSSQSSYYIASMRGQNFLPKSKTELEEMRNNNNDYYSLFQEEYIQKKLKDEKDNCTEFEIYSDQIFLLMEKKILSKRYIMLTPSNLYIIEPKEMVFNKVIKKENILSFQISNKNINIILFQIKDSDNILLETLRRMDLLLYLRDHYRKDKKLIKFKYEDKFNVKIKGKQTAIDVKDKIFANLSNFDGALKIGYLLKFRGKFIQNIFKEKLFILTSIGLIQFDEPSSPPKKLFPIIGSHIEKIEGNKYGRENCFKITFLSGKTKIFATRKKRERDSWLKEFERIIKEFQDKMKQLDTMNKKFIEYSDKSLLPLPKEEKLKEEEK